MTSSSEQPPEELLETFLGIIVDLKQVSRTVKELSRQSSDQSLTETKIIVRRDGDSHDRTFTLAPSPVSVRPDCVRKPHEFSLSASGGLRVTKCSH